MGDSLRERILNSIGIGLLLLCFVISIGRIAWNQFRPRGEAGQGGRVTIRFAHWQLEGGVREAFDKIAEEYMTLHPNVKVVQIPVPDRIYTNWLITQLVGGTAPDIIALGFAITDERRVRYFRPISDLVNLPNPWNKGTDLEGVPLRETFFDGMESCFVPALLEYYGMPISAFTVRMYYNLDLLHEVTGSEVLPTTYEELVDLSRKISEYSKATGRQIFPIAGSRYNAPQIMNALFASQTEQLAGRVAYDFLANRPSATFLAQAAARGEWTLDAPEIQAGLKLVRDLGQYMQPGFLQLGRDDATFYFVQGKAAMIATGSWDATSITSQADFRVGVGYIPVPSAGSPMGPFSPGPMADSSALAGVVMGLTRQSENPEVALDFLYFMASKPRNQVFTDVSKWPPSVVGVIPNEQSKMFQPFLEGYIGGFTLEFGGADTTRAYSTAFNRLVSPQGSVESFTKAFQEDFMEGLGSDMSRKFLDARASAQRSDTTLGALAWVTLQEADNKAAAEKLDLLIQSVSGGDFNAYRVKRTEKIVSESLK